MLFLHNESVRFDSVCASTLQQYNNIKHQTDLQVEEYYGAKGVDTWNLKTWEKEISDNDVCLFINLLNIFIY